jgi:hypothetical protein
MVAADAAYSPGRIADGGFYEIRPMSRGSGPQ